MKKILLSLCIVLLLVTGCGKVSKLENGKDAVVSFKDSKIAIDDLYNEIKDKYAINTLLDMIDTKILNDKYKATDEEKTQVESQISTWIKSFKTEQALLQQTQSAFGISTMEGLRSYLSLQYKRGKAVEDYAKGLVTDKDIDKYYNDKVFGDIKASHILIKSGATDSMTAEEKATKDLEALNKAKSLIEQLKAGADFATLAKDNSGDEGSASKGGDLGYFTQGKMVAGFENAAKNLKNGEYSKEPVKSQFGYHIILKVDQKEKAPKDTLKDTIIETLSKNKLESDKTLQITALMELRKNAGMKIEDSSLKSQYDLLMEQTKKQATEAK
ncbi:MAG: peptidylprolyl isomerase [Bacilli bacterium]